MLTTSQISRLAALSEGDDGVLGNVVVSATLDAATGALGPVTGVKEKLRGAIEQKHLPAIGAFAVSAEQRDLLEEPGMEKYKKDTTSPRLLSCTDFGSLIDQLAGLQFSRPGVRLIDFHHELQATYRPADFEGRHWLFERIERILQEHDGGFIVVSGGMGFGKTTFALRLIERWRDGRCGNVALGGWHFLRKTDAAQSPAARMVAQLEGRLRLRLGCPLGANAPAVNDQNAAEVLREEVLPEVAKKAADLGKRLLLVVDGLDEAFGQNSAQALEQFDLLRRIFPGPKELPAGVFVLFTSRPGVHLTHWLGEEAFRIDVDTDPEARRDNESDLHRYLEARLLAAADPGGYDPQQVHVLAQRMTSACEGGFYVAQWFARKVEKVSTDEEARAQFERWLAGAELPRGIDATLREDWRHKLGSLRQDSQRRLLPVLVAAIAIWHEAGTKVTDQIIEDLFRAGRKSDLDVGDIEAGEIRGPAVRACLQKLHDWFDAGAEDNPPSYTFRHSRTQEFVLQELVDLQTQREVHRLLASTSSQWKVLHGDSRRAALANAPWHFALARILGSDLKDDAIEGGAMRLLAHWREPQPYLAAVYAELDNAVAVLGRNYAAAIQLAATDAGQSHRSDNDKEPDPLMHLRDVWRVLSEYGELLREPCCPLAPTLYNHLAAAWDPDSQALKDLVQAADDYPGTWLQRMNPEPPDRRLVAVLEREDVTAVAWSPDGSLLASTWSFGVRSWTPYSGALKDQKPFSEIRSSRDCATWSPDGKRLVRRVPELRTNGSTVGALARHSRLSLLDTLAEDESSIGLVGNSGEIDTLAWSPDGKRLAVSNGDGTLGIWNLLTRELQGDCTSAASTAFKLLAWSPLEGKRLASISRTADFRLWDTETCAQISALSRILCTTWSPDASRFATGSWDGELRLWDAQTGEPIGGPLVEHEQAIEAVVWSPNGMLLASGSRDSTVRIWNLQARRLWGETLRGSVGGVTCLAWSPDSRLVASGSKDGNLVIWDLKTRLPLSDSTSGHADPITCLLWSIDGARLASLSSGGELRLWDVKSPVAYCGSNPKGYLDRKCLAWSPNGEQIASVSLDGIVCITEPQATRLSHHELREAVGPISQVFWSPDGTELATASVDGTVQIWNARTRIPICNPLAGHGATVEQIAWSPGGERVATISRDNTVRVWDTHAGALLKTLSHECDVFARVAWSPGGRRLAAIARVGGAVRIWNAETFALLDEISVRGQLRGNGCRLLWSPDGTRLAVGSINQTAVVCHLDGEISDRVSAPVAGYARECEFLAWSPDGALLAVGGYGVTSEDRPGQPAGLIVVARSDNGDGSGMRLIGHQENVMAVAWSQDGSDLLSLAADGEVRAWDMKRYECIASARSGCLQSKLRLADGDCLVLCEKVSAPRLVRYCLHKGRMPI